MMGSWDGAELCELCDLFFHMEITTNSTGIPKQQLGLYGDGGLIALRASKWELNTLRKTLERLFAKHSLKITTETGMQKTDYLDITLNLSNDTFEPFRKDKLIPVYINKRSNHPPTITKNLPRMIEKRV